MAHSLYLLGRRFFDKLVGKIYPSLPLPTPAPFPVLTPEEREEKVRAFFNGVLEQAQKRAAAEKAAEAEGFIVTISALAPEEERIKLWELHRTWVLEQFGVAIGEIPNPTGDITN